MTQHSVRTLHSLACWSLFLILVAGCTQDFAEDGGTSLGSGGDDTASAYQVRERFNFASAEEMVTASDVVVVARVTSVGPGRSVGDPEATIDFLEVELSIEMMVKGLNSSDPIIIEFEPMPPVGDFAGYPPFEPDSPWWRPGSTSMFFLRTTTSGRLQVINSQGLYYLPEGPGGVLQSTKPGDQIGATAAGRTVTELSESLGLGSN